ncbi:MAG: hypothetical protein JO088_14865 [Acidobacteria bacterium]|nr:hypothetical protein [Acidobacteriota bacterium]
MRAVVVAAAVFAAVTALAQEQHPTVQPDYSRDALLHFVARDDIKMSPLPDHLPPGRIEWHVGWLQFRGLGMQWRVVYLPIAMPLAGSGMQSTGRVPDPLEMASTRVAGNTDVFAERSASVDREMKRVIKLQRQARKP